MSNLIEAIRRLDKSTRELHGRFYPDNPPSLDVRLAVFGEEYGEFVEAWTHLKEAWVLSSLAAIAPYENDACKEAADLIVTILGLLHYHAIDPDTIIGKIEHYTQIVYEDGYRTLRQLYRDQVSVAAYSDGRILVYFTNIATRFIADAINILQENGIETEDIIAAMQAVVVKNDAKTVENGYGVNSAGKIAKAGG